MARFATTICFCLLGLLGAISQGCGAETKSPRKSADAETDKSDDADKGSGPNLYIDLSTSLASAPGSTLLVGFRNFSTLKTSSSKSFTIDAPITYDFNDHFSIYGGVGFLSSKSAGADWSTLKINNWTVGFSADLIEQSTWIPTVTLNGSFSRPFEQPAPGVNASTWSTGLDLDYGLDDDDTQGLLAGASITKTIIEGAIGRVNAGYVIYGGAYKKLTDTWKLTAKAGLSISGGATALRFISLKRAEQPFSQLTLERVDANDNTLFGVSFTFASSPKPSFMLSVNTPLYIVRN